MSIFNQILSESFEAIIAQRGKHYFLSNYVNIISNNKLKVKALVTGTQSYLVKIHFDDSFYPLSYSCTCPFFSQQNCKHLAALLYKLREIGFFLNTDEPLNTDNNSKNTKPKQLKSTNNYNPAIPDNDISFEMNKNLLNKKILPLIPQSKTQKKIIHKIVFAIFIKNSCLSISPLKQRLLIDGTVADIQKAHTINFDNVLPLSLEERLVVNLLNNNFNSIYIGFDINSPKEIINRQTANDIFEALTGKEVYFYYNNLTAEKIEISGEPGYCKLILDDENENINLKLQYYIGANKIPSGTKIFPILDKPLWVLADKKLFNLTNIEYKQLKSFVDSGSIIAIPKIYIEYFNQNLLPQITTKLPLISEKFIVETIDIEPVKQLYLEENNATLLITLKFGYKEFVVEYNEDELISPFIVKNIITHIKRNKEYESAARNETKNSFVKELQPGLYMPRNNPIDFLFKYLQQFIEMGFEIYGRENLKKFKINQAVPNTKYFISSGVDWFDFETQIDFNGAAVSLESLLESIKNKKSYVNISDGTIGVIPEEWIEKFKKFLAFGEIKENTIRFLKIHASALDMIISDLDNVDIDEKFGEYIEKLKTFTGIKTHLAPKSFKGKLRDYQKAGLNWLYFLKDYSFGGILADDMGLGKTIQVLALLAKEKRNKNSSPSLIIAPTSVVFNWINEAKKFVPSLKMINHTGNERDSENNTSFDKYDVILTSYSILLRDYNLFIDKKFHYIILDESQKIKNPIAKTSRLVRVLKSSYRLCLTGTPVENNINELWSQMAFLNPGLFGSLNKFQETFTKPIQKENDIPAADFLKRTINPFILRRTKELVEQSLPPKTEMVHYCSMSEEQKEFYKIWKDAIRYEVIKEIEEKGIKKSGFKVIEGLLRLRQICNHPALVDGKYKRTSGKFEDFKEMIQQIIGEDHKVLVFSQFVKMLDIISTYLKNKRIAYEYLTGNTKDREKCVDNFQNNPQVKIFLISLKAGGFGLNLTAADYVFHYDPWWNPAVEAQATDRAHRIGQKKNIFAYKFITKDTVEEKILHLQAKKRELVRNIISTETGILKNLTREDIDLLFE